MNILCFSYIYIHNIYNSLCSLENISQRQQENLSYKVCQMKHSLTFMQIQFELSFAPLPSATLNTDQWPPLYFLKPAAESAVCLDAVQDAGLFWAWCRVCVSVCVCFPWARWRTAYHEFNFWCFGFLSFILLCFLYSAATNLLMVGGCEKDAKIFI